MANEPNIKRGEDSPQAVLTDREVELIRELYESNARDDRGKRMWTIKKLAVKFEISKSHCGRIVSYRAR